MIFQYLPEVYQLDDRRIVSLIQLYYIGETFVIGDEFPMGRNSVDFCNE